MLTFKKSVLVKAISCITIITFLYNESVYSLSLIRPGIGKSNARIEEAIRQLDKEYIVPERTILFGVSGGDCAGLNAVLAGLVKSAEENGLQVAVMDGGFKTLCANHEMFKQGLRLVNPDESENLMYLPSIISGSSRVKLDEKNQENVFSNVDGFCAVVMIGGDDHARQVGKLSELLKERNINVPVFSVLKTVDNDTTAKPVGADTAIEHQRQDFLSTCVTAWAHRRPSVYEEMGRERGWITIGAGDIRISGRDKEVKGREWILKQIGPSIINLIPERTSYLADLLIEVVKRMGQDEVLYDGKLRNIGKRISLYANVNVCEGYEFEDIGAGHHTRKDTLFYKLLELDLSLKEKFYAIREYDIHGNPKLAGVSDYISSAIKYLPELAKYNSRLEKALDELRNRMKENGIPEEELFKKEKVSDTEERMIISGVRQNLPNFIIRGLSPNEQDRTYGFNIGRHVFRVIGRARRQINSGKGLSLTGLSVAINKDEDPLARKPRLMHIEESAKGQDVVSVYSDEELSKMGVWWNEEPQLKTIIYEGASGIKDTNTFAKTSYRRKIASQQDVVSDSERDAILKNEVKFVLKWVKLFLSLSKADQEETLNILSRSEYYERRAFFNILKQAKEKDFKRMNYAVIRYVLDPEVYPQSNKLLPERKEILRSLKNIIKQMMDIGIPLGGMESSLVHEILNNTYLVPDSLYVKYIDDTYTKGKVERIGEDEVIFINEYFYENRYKKFCSIFAHEVMHVLQRRNIFIMGEYEKAEPDGNKEVIPQAIGDIIGILNYAGRDREGDILFSEISDSEKSSFEIGRMTYQKYVTYEERIQYLKESFSEFVSKYYVDEDYRIDVDVDIEDHMQEWQFMLGSAMAGMAYEMFVNTQKKEYIWQYIYLLSTNIIERVVSAMSAEYVSKVVSGGDTKQLKHIFEKGNENNVPSHLIWSKLYLNTLVIKDSALYAAIKNLYNQLLDNPLMLRVYTEEGIINLLKEKYQDLAETELESLEMFIRVLYDIYRSQNDKQNRDRHYFLRNVFVDDEERTVMAGEVL